MQKLLQNKKIVKYIVTLQEAYSAVIPYFLLLSFFILLRFLIEQFNISVPAISLESLKHTITLMQRGAPLIITVSISYFLAIRLKVCEIIAITLSLATLFTIIYLKTLSVPIEIPPNFSPLALINPIISTFFLYLLYPYFTLNLPESDENKHVYRFFNYLFVFVVSYLTTIFLYIIADIIINTLYQYIVHLKLNIPNFILYLLRDLTIQIYWFFGIHGSRTVNAIFGKDILSEYIVDHLTYGDFNRLFVVIGGAGVGIALLISMLLYIKDKSYRIITKISVPFVIFNINTLLIYALVVFNRFLLIPFIFLPILNILVAYGAIKLFNISFNDQTLVWMTPVFVDGYIKTGGDIKIWLLQAFLITMDTMVYIYFVKKYQKAKDLENKADILKKNLEIEKEIRSKMYVKAYTAQKEIIEADAKLGKILENLTKNNLYVYYQPKITLHNLTCNKFEALLRYEQNGKIIGPIFLDAVEKAGLAPIIDIWVAKRVKKDMDLWEKEGFHPQISINLHPDTITSNDSINKIIEILKGKDIIFEIIERSFLKGSNALQNLNRLQKEGFSIAIDDFGTGYSSLQTLVKLNVEELKFDKSIIDIIETQKGEIICKNITTICHNIGSKVVAEGVERENQVKILKSIDIDFIQGFYYSKALPFNEIIPFVKEFEKSAQKEIQTATI
ncbi:MAG: EAL domain-containing protein [Epsilonproteobacteria bacterium]|nr:EAL domain-containing protein [Campylobacterota bacterium]